MPRLGDYLVEKGLLSEEELARALEFQQQAQSDGEPKLIGQALVELGLISQEKLDQSITEQIFQLQSALRRANEELEDRVRERTSELEDALNRLSELNQLKSNFVANVSHELRTPLTHLRGYLELFENDGLGPLNEGQKKRVASHAQGGKTIGILDRGFDPILHLHAWEIGSLSEAARYHRDVEAGGR